MHQYLIGKAMCNNDLRIMCQAIKTIKEKFGGTTVGPNPMFKGFVYNVPRELTTEERTEVHAIPFF